MIFLLFCNERKQPQCIEIATLRLSFRSNFNINLKRNQFQYFIHNSQRLISKIGLKKCQEKDSETKKGIKK